MSYQKPFQKNKGSKNRKETPEPLQTRYKIIPDVNLQTIPVINLQGLWLEDAGFWCGDRVKVEVSHRCIVIRPAEELEKK